MSAKQFDVVVVGCGVAGLRAAVAAAEVGAKLAVLERSTYDERGGNTRYTTAAMRMKSDDAVSDYLLDVFGDNSGYHVQPDFIEATVQDRSNCPPQVRAASFTDPELISFFADEAPPAIAWLKAHGVKFGGIGFYGLTPRASPRIAISGGGLHLVEVMTAHAEKIGVKFFYESTAQRLMQNARGDVCGLHALSKAEGACDFQCGAVILACGGFEGNAEMVVRYIGAKGRYLRPVARGGYYNKGEGIAMALAIGAAPAGDFAEYHTQPIDPRSPGTEPIVMIYPCGVLLNTDGQRFIDEALGPIDASYEDTTRVIADQKKGLAFRILDDKINAIENWQRCVRSTEPPVTAPDIETLAHMLGFDGAAAARTIADYNRACRNGVFNPYTLDGLTTEGLTPAKSNYAVPLDKPPFHAYPVISSNTFTFGGLKVDTNCQVVNADGDAMPGLFAAGETVGIYYGKYPGATSVLRGAVFGKRAGEQAARRFS